MSKTEEIVEETVAEETVAEETKTATPTTIKYDSVEVPIGDGTSQFIPDNSKKYIDHGNMLKTLAIGIRDNMAVLLIGESGTGKTSAIRHMAQETNHGLRRINLNGGTTADELVGRMLINDKGTYWVDGVLTEAMRTGDWIVFDEINAALPEVLFVLQSVMDDDGYLVLTEKDDKELVRKHPDFRIFATCNPPEYAGTKEMNKALLSRFGICVNAEFPKKEVELEIIEHHLGKSVAESDMAVKLVDIANETRSQRESGKSDYEINTRDILNILQLSKTMEPMEAVTMGFANKLEPADSAAFKTYATLYVPSSRAKAKAVRVPVTDTNQFEIGKKYVLNADLQSCYFGLDKYTIAGFKEIQAKGLADIIMEKSQENGIKGDEFMVVTTYYENENASSDKNLDTAIAGQKTGSAIKIIGGPNKGKKAVIIHNSGVQDATELLATVFEIS
jgi:cobaltochelatase CobS